MANKKINRIKVVLADKGRTNKWLTERLGKDPATVSKWCTNAAQPSLEVLIQIAKELEVEIQELIRDTDS
jgi:transcriptional regulator with XRE-family HTH domain